MQSDTIDAIIRGYAARREFTLPRTEDVFAGNFLYGPRLGVYDIGSLLPLKKFAAFSSWSECLVPVPFLARVFY